ncbi:MAG: hypothetical protein J1F32_04990 [Erysipelotrichales bacterium]|nr:hypothetical protein [Erysipelotrichales bacterium]
MKPFRYVLKSLFNNSVIIEGRKRKWIESFIIFVLAMIIALIPTVVTIASVKGSALLDANSNGVDEGLKYFSETMNKKQIKFKIKEENKEKVITIEESDFKWGENDNDTDGYYFNNRGEDNYFIYERYDGDKRVERLRVYQLINLDANAFSDKIESIRNQSIETTPTSSFMAIGKTSSYLCVYSKASESWASPIAARFLTYDRFEDGQEVISSYVGEHSLNNWKEFIDTSYTSTKITSLFTQVGIYAALNFGISLFMAIMVFIITRGKNNPYRDYKFIEAIKIVSVASLTPSIIAALIGFILPAYSTMLFMVILGVRIMWLTSKNLNPAIRN